ncbi:hypothetical protein [Streptomyces malaysiensis]
MTTAQPPLTIAVWVQIGDRMHCMSTALAHPGGTAEAAMENIPPMLRTVALQVEDEIDNPSDLADADDD